MTGIYKITNLLNNKVYIGQSINIEKRFEEHKRGIKERQDLWYYLIREEINSLEDCLFEIIEECKQEELNEREKYWIKYYRADLSEFGYNALFPNQRYVFIEDINLSQEELYEIIKTFSSPALKLFLYFSAQKGLIPLSPKELNGKIGMSESSYRRAFKELEERGRIILKQEGDNPIYIFN